MDDIRTEPTTETATQARGAVIGHHASTVLAISTLGVVIIFGGLWLYFFA